MFVGDVEDVGLDVCELDNVAGAQAVDDVIHRVGESSQEERTFDFIRLKHGFHRSRDRLRGSGAAFSHPCPAAIEFVHVQAQVISVMVAQVGE